MASVPIKSVGRALVWISSHDISEVGVNFAKLSWTLRHNDSNGDTGTMRVENREREHNPDPLTPNADT